MGLLHVFVKYLLFILNLVFTIFGIAVIVLGVLIHFELNFFPGTFFDEIIKNENLAELLQIISIAVIFLGCVMVFVAFSGCCGAVTETKCLLVTFSMSMLLLLIAKIYLTVVWTNGIDSFRHTVEEFMNDNYESNNVTLHIMEASLYCCGTTGPEVYEILPPTCCGITEIDNIENECLLEDAFDIGCNKLIDNYIASVAHTVKTILICVIVFEAFELIGAVYLCTSIIKRRSKQKQYY